MIIHDKRENASRKLADVLEIHLELLREFLHIFELLSSLIQVLIADAVSVKRLSLLKSLLEWVCVSLFGSGWVHFYLCVCGYWI